MRFTCRALRFACRALRFACRALRFVRGTLRFARGTLFRFLTAHAIFRPRRLHELPVHRVRHHLLFRGAGFQIRDPELKPRQHFGMDQAALRHDGDIHSTCVQAEKRPFFGVVENKIFFYSARRVLGFFDFGVAFLFVFVAVRQGFHAQIENPVVTAVVHQQRHGVGVQHHAQIRFADHLFIRQGHLEAHFQTHTGGDGITGEEKVE